MSKPAKLFIFEVTRSGKWPVYTYTFRLYYSRALFVMLTLGLSCALLFGFGPSVYEKLFSVKEETPIASLEKNYIPERVLIPSIEFEMPVKDATVSANDWEVFDDAVSWLKTSGTLEKGNIILYGHNDKNKFGKIIRLKVGDVIVIRNKHYEKWYEVVKGIETNSSDLTYLQNTEDGLTMYTCSGWFDSKRYFVIAKPVEE